MKKTFLPIGSVVLLKEADKEIMITSYCVIPENSSNDSSQDRNEGLQIFDYGACPYPEGILDSDVVCAFNHDQIEKVLFKGYENVKSQMLTKTLSENYDKIIEEIQKKLNNI